MVIFFKIFQLEACQIANEIGEYYYEVIFKKEIHYKCLHRIWNRNKLPKRLMGRNGYYFTFQPSAMNFRPSKIYN